MEKKKKKKNSINSFFFFYKFDNNSVGPKPPNTVLVSRLSPLMTEVHITTFFSVYGQVSNVDIEKCPTTGGSMGIAHVEFTSDFERDAHTAACLAVEKGNGRKMGAAECVKVCFDPNGNYKYWHIKKKRFLFTMII
jgi:hypothetical protein